MSGYNKVLTLSLAILLMVLQSCGGGASDEDTPSLGN